MKERCEVLKNKDKFSGIGIKLVYGIAKGIIFLIFFGLSTIIKEVIAFFIALSYKELKPENSKGDYHNER